MFTDTKNLAEVKGYFILPLVSASTTQTSTIFYLSPQFRNWHDKIYE